MDASELEAFEKMAASRLPGFKVRFKNESTFMKFLGLLVTPINPAFMTKFLTTIGRTVYVPDRVFYVEAPAVRLRTLSHEYVHAWDAQQHWWFKLSYLFPQILAVIPLLIFGVLAWPHSWLLAMLLGVYLGAVLLGRVHKVLFWGTLGLGLVAMVALSIWLTGWVALALGAVVLCLVPWPAPWRTKWELRGYGMSLASLYWMTGSCSFENIDFFVQQFTGPNYFFMSWNRLAVRMALEEALRKATTLAILDDPPYQHVYDFLRERGLLQP